MKITLKITNSERAKLGDGAATLRSGIGLEIAAEDGGGVSGADGVGYRMPFKTLGLCDALVRGILDTGYETPTAIQAQAIPPALAGHDVIGCAQTGTGKTAAFVLPMLNRLGGATAPRPERGRGSVRALVLTPTRELAAQVEAAVRTYGRHLALRSTALFGGVSYGAQIAAMQRGVDIVVATPGRLIDLMGTGRVVLDRVEYLVLDEADRMLDMGFIQSVKRIVAAVPRERQTLLFSATMSPAVRALAADMLRHPRIVEVGPARRTVASVSQQAFRVTRERKLDLLCHLLLSQELDCVLVFTRTKHGADRVAQRLEKKDIRAAALHANRTQNQRLRALEGFKSGHYRVLVATDIAARGIDVDGISHVINFDTPVHAEDYIHRIGRTGRAAATGDALTFVAPEEDEYWRRIQRFTGQRMDLKAPPAFAVEPSGAGAKPAGAMASAPASPTTGMGTGQAGARERRDPRHAVGKPGPGASAREPRSGSPHRSQGPRRPHGPGRRIFRRGRD